MDAKQQWMDAEGNAMGRAVSAALTPFFKRAKTDRGAAAIRVLMVSVLCWKARSLIMCAAVQQESLQRLAREIIDGKLED